MFPTSATARPGSLIPEIKFSGLTFSMKASYVVKLFLFCITAGFVYPTIPSN